MVNVGDQMQMPCLMRKAAGLVIVTQDFLQDEKFIQAFETTSYSSLMLWQMWECFVK